MILTTILWIVYLTVTLFAVPITALPNATLPDSITSAISTLGVWNTTLATFFPPISTVFFLFGLFLSIQLAIFSYKLIMWVIRLIPGIG